jgi:hypothetical protein
MAICNACGDRREQIMSLERKIFRCCRMLHMQPKMNDATKGRIRDALFVSTRLYANVIAEAYNAEVLWQQDFVDLLMEQPGKAGIILSKYRASAQAKLAKQEQEMSGRPLPGSERPVARRASKGSPSVGMD